MALVGERLFSGYPGWDKDDPSPQVTLLSRGAHRSVGMGSLPESKTPEHRRQVSHFIGKTEDTGPERQGRHSSCAPSRQGEPSFLGGAREDGRREGSIPSSSPLRLDKASRGVAGENKLRGVFSEQGEKLPRDRCSQLGVWAVARLAGRRGLSGLLLGQPNTSLGRRVPLHRWC